MKSNSASVETRFLSYFMADRLEHEKCYLVDFWLNILLFSVKIVIWRTVLLNKFESFACKSKLFCRLQNTQIVLNEECVPSSMSRGWSLADSSRNKVILSSWRLKLITSWSKPLFATDQVCTSYSHGISIKPMVTGLTRVYVNINYKPNI